MGAGSVVVVEGPSLLLAVPAAGTFTGLDNLLDLADDDDEGGGVEVPFVRGLEVWETDEAGGTPCWIGESFWDGEVGGSGDFAGDVSAVGSFEDAAGRGGLEGWVRVLDRVLVDVGLERFGERERE